MRGPLPPSVFTPATDVANRPTASKCKKGDIHLKTVQFNGQSMRDAHRRGAKGKPRLARLTVVRQQFHEWGAHLVGLPEGRNEPGAKPIGNFWCVSAGHLDYNLGCELWVNTRLEYGTCSGKGLFSSLATSKDSTANLGSWLFGVLRPEWP